MLASANQAETERLQLDLVELIRLIKQPLQNQLVGIDQCKPDDPTARDYVTEELFAVAVRFFEINGHISELATQLCCEILTYIAPSKYGGLTPTTMAQLISGMAKNVPQRYSELPDSAFLSVSLLSQSDQTDGTNYSEKFVDCLSRFSLLISKTHEEDSGKEGSEKYETEAAGNINQVHDEDGLPRDKKEPELQPVGQRFKINPAHEEGTLPRAKEEPELHQITEGLNFEQVIGDEKNLCTSEKHDTSQVLARTNDLLAFLRRFKLSAGTALGVVLREAKAISARISRSLQDMTHWLKAPMK